MILVFIEMPWDGGRGPRFWGPSPGSDWKDISAAFDFCPGKQGVHLSSPWVSIWPQRSPTTDLHHFTFHLVPAPSPRPLGWERQPAVSCSKKSTSYLTPALLSGQRGLSFTFFPRFSSREPDRRELSFWCRVLGAVWERADKWVPNSSKLRRSTIICREHLFGWSIHFVVQMFWGQSDSRPNMHMTISLCSCFIERHGFLPVDP